MSNIPNRPAPARGARDGVKKDFVAAKTARQEGRASEVDGEAGRGGSAWSHNFLNQKPWHPGSYRNRLHTWEAEQKALREEKMKEEAKAEMEAEQEMMKTLSYLSAEEQQKYRDRQSIQFMYAKPPGLDAVMAKEKEQEKKQAQVLANPVEAKDAATAAAAAAKEAEEERRRQMDLEKVRADPYKDMLKAKMALANNDRYAIKQAEGAVFGGYAAGSANQHMLEDDDMEEGTMAVANPGSSLAGDLEEDEIAMLASLSEKDRAKVLKRLKKVKRKKEEEQKLKEAEAILVAAGYDLKACRDVSRDGDDSRAKKKHKSKGSKEGEKKHHKKKDKR